MAKAQAGTVSSAIAEAGESNSAWRGQTFVMLTYWDGAVLLYKNTDPSVRIVEGMGLAIHPKLHEWSVEGQSSFAISEVLLPELDADVLFWWAVPDNIPMIEALVARDGMRAKSEGRDPDSPAIVRNSHGLAGHQINGVIEYCVIFMIH